MQVVGEHSFYVVISFFVNVLQIDFDIAAGAWQL